MKKIIFILACLIPVSLVWAKVEIKIPESSHVIISPFERNFRFVVKVKNIGDKPATISFGNESKTNADNKNWIIIFPSGRIYLEPGEEQEILATFEPMFNNKSQDEINYNYVFNVDAGKETVPIKIKTQKLDFGSLQKTSINLTILDKVTGKKITNAQYYFSLPSGMDGFSQPVVKKLEEISSSVINSYVLANNVQLSFTGNFLRIEKSGYKPIYLSNVKTGNVPQTVYMEPQTEYFNYRETASHKTEFSFWWIKPSADNKLFATSPGIHAAPGENNIPTEVGIYLYDNWGKQLWRYPIKSAGYDNSDLCWGLDIAPNGQYIAAGCYDGNVYLLDRAGKLIQKYSTGNMVDVVAFSPDSRFLAFGPAKENKDVGIINVSTGQYVWVADLGDRARTLVFSPDSKLLSAGSPNGIITMFDISGKRLWRNSNGGLVPFVNNFSGDGKMIIVGGKGREIIAYEPLTGRKLWSKIIDQTPWPGVNNISFDGHLAFGTVGGLLWYLDKNGNPLWRYEYGNFGHNGAYLTKNGEYFLLGGGDPTLFDKNGAILWELYPGTDRNKLMRTPKENIVGAETVWLSEDATKMVLGMSDGTIKFLEGKKVTKTLSITKSVSEIFSSRAFWLAAFIVPTLFIPTILFSGNR